MDDCKTKDGIWLHGKYTSKEAMADTLVWSQIPIENITRIINEMFPDYEYTHPYTFIEKEQESCKLCGVVGCRGGCYYD